MRPMIYQPTLCKLDNVFFSGFLVTFLVSCVTQNVARMQKIEFKNRRARHISRHVSGKVS